MIDAIPKPRTPYSFKSPAGRQGAAGGATTAQHQATTLMRSILIVHRPQFHSGSSPFTGFTLQLEQFSQVLPEDMVVLAEPSPVALVQALDRALAAAPAVDRHAQHARVGFT